MAPSAIQQVRAGAKANALAQSAGSLFSLLQLRSLKNIAVFVHRNVGNKAGNLGEHHTGNNDKLNVVFITAALA